MARSNHRYLGGQFLIAHFEGNVFIGEFETEEHAERYMRHYYDGLGYRVVYMALTVHPDDKRKLESGEPFAGEEK